MCYWAILTHDNKTFRTKQDMYDSIGVAIRMCQVNYLLNQNTKKLSDVQLIHQCSKET